MTEAKEAEQSFVEKSKSINSEQDALEDTEMREEERREEMEEAEHEAEPEEDEDEETEESENEDDEQEKQLKDTLVDVSNNGIKEMHAETSSEKSSDEVHENNDSPVDTVKDGRDLQAGNAHSNVDEDDPDREASLKIGLVSSRKSTIDDVKGSMGPDVEEDIGVKVDTNESLNHKNAGDETNIRTHMDASPTSQSSPSKVEHIDDELKEGTKIEEVPEDVEIKNTSDLFMFDTDTSGGGDAGTKEEQAAFIMELRKFYKARGLDFKPPKFYGVPLNLLKLWRAVIKLGGYDEATTCKYWRQVGESFRPPKTCTTISWTFRIFYEKALLEYERYRASVGAGLPALSAAMGAENQAPGSGRALRDSAARAMQGWHSQRVLDNGEVSDPIIKEKNSIPLSKKEKPLKSLGGILKRKRSPSTDDAIKSVQMKLPNIHSDATVIDIGSPADWVKINVRATRDCYEVYALVPGLLREEVRVQSDPAGRLVISGEPENPDNPWNVTPFKKVVSLPSRIDPHQTSAVVTLHGQLFVRVPFEQYD
ncbi:hypothetical protein vseg_020812 [Gypsophila vaccaria]